MELQNDNAYDFFGWLFLNKEYPQAIKLLIAFHEKESIMFKRDSYFYDWIFKKEFYNNPVLLKDFFEQNGIIYTLEKDSDGLLYRYMVNTETEIIFCPDYTEYDVTVKKVIYNCFMLLEKALKQEKKIIT